MQHLQGSCNATRSNGYPMFVPTIVYPGTNGSFAYQKA